MGCVSHFVKRQLRLSALNERLEAASKSDQVMLNILS